MFTSPRPGSEARLQTVNIRKENALHWTKQLKALAKDLKIKDDISLRDICKCPYVMEHQDRLSLLPGELKMVEGQLRKAASQCQAFRAREGGMLKKELLAQLKNLEASIVDMQGWREEAMKSAGQRLKSRLATLEGEQLDASRLALETALLIDKMDVHEEVVRLTEHVKALPRIDLTRDNSGQGQGKKLDFTAKNFCAK